MGDNVDEVEYKPTILAYPITFMGSGSFVRAKPRSAGHS